MAGELFQEGNILEGFLVGVSAEMGIGGETSADGRIIGSPVYGTAIILVQIHTADTSRFAIGHTWQGR